MVFLNIMLIDYTWDFIKKSFISQLNDCYLPFILLVRVALNVNQIFNWQVLSIA